MRAVLAIVLLLPLALGASGLTQERGFPHERHDRLFPTCEGCHRGLASEVPAPLYPEATSCANCHNGVDAERVTWEPRPRPGGFLRFSHQEHARQVEEPARRCTSCHSGEGEERMRVRRAAPDGCLSCHSHRASAHLGDDNRCAACHVPIAAAPELPLARIAAFPKPPSHERARFVTDHAAKTPLARESCATCHSRESCARCHVNAATLPATASLASDGRFAALARGKEPAYPKPDDHRKPEFPSGHGIAVSPERCGTCHSQQSCAQCHLSPGQSDVLDRIPKSDRGTAPGVQLVNPARARGAYPSVRTAPPMEPRNQRAYYVRVHDPAFATEHRGAIGTGALTCSNCHTASFCSDCHAGEGRRRFHRANFAQAHADAAFSRESDCAACHSNEAFCRECHRSAGLTAKGRLDVAFHTAQPLWLLQHGRAARQGIESCAACHAQRDCMACHSTTGWGISPHGRNFDAAREARRAPTSCLLCHLQVPGRSPP